MVHGTRYGLSPGGGTTSTHVCICTHTHTYTQDRAGIEVIHALVQRNIAFAGAHTRCFDQSKPQQKAAALRMGLHTPRALVIQGVDGDDDDDNVQQV